MSVTIGADTLKAVFKAISTQVETVKVMSGEEGWHLYGRSKDNTSVVDASIPKEAFASYERWDDIVVDVKDILEPAAKARDEVEIDISSGRLDIKAGRLSFRRKLVGDIEVNPRMPKPELDTESIADVGVYADILSAAAGDMRFKAIRVSQTEEGMTLSVFADDTDIGTVSCTLPADAFVMLSGEGSARYSAGIWYDLMKAIPSGAEVDMLFKKDYPMLMSYTVGGAEVRMMIAPQVEGDE